MTVNSIHLALMQWRETRAAIARRTTSLLREGRSKLAILIDSNLNADRRPAHVASYAEFQRVRRFGSLDGLRAVAICGVIWHHGPGESFPLPLLQKGFFGVHLFFAISGFLITTLLLRESRATGQISLRNFYSRRALRIFPLYYAVIALYVVIVAALRLDEPAGVQFLRNLPYFLTYTSNWFVPLVVAGPAPIFVLAWSLATEEQFYCTWPVLQKYLSHWPRVIVITMVAGLAFSIGAGFFDAVMPSSLFGTMLRSISLPICMGVLLAHFLDSQRGFEFVSRTCGRRTSSAVLAIAVLVALAMPTPTVVVELLLVALVVSAVIREDHALARLFHVPFMVRIGIVSYGMYLYHPLVYNALTQLGGVVTALPPRRSPSGFFLTLIVTLIVATASYQYFETRFLRLKVRFVHRPQRAEVMVSDTTQTAADDLGHARKHTPVVLQ
jgi:peptidoglycan/LPS O-acetylase OafA/YrhL